MHVVVLIPREGYLLIMEKTNGNTIRAVSQITIENLDLTNLRILNIKPFIDLKPFSHLRFNII